MSRLQVAARYAIGGLRVTLRADDPRPLAPLLARWSLVPRAPRGRCDLRFDALTRPRRWRVIENGRSLHAGRGPHRDAALRARLELAVYAGVARETAATPLHAAAVELPAGVILLVGPSGAGKTSLAQALQRLGGGYLGEEHAFLGDDLQVEGLPRAQQLDAPPPPGAEELGGVFAPPLRLGRRGAAAGVVLLDPARREDGALTTVAPAEAAARLTAATHRPPRPGDLRRLAALAAAVPVRGLAKTGVEASAALILEQWGG